MPTDPIKHVVVLMLENHSFDQMLGGLKAVIPDVDGVDPAAPGQNTDADGKISLRSKPPLSASRTTPSMTLITSFINWKGATATSCRTSRRHIPNRRPKSVDRLWGIFHQGHWLLSTD